MSIIKKMRKQDAVWWKRQPSPDRFGEFTFDPPVAIRCRWDDSVVEFLDAQGERQISRSVVYVDRIMSPGDMLREGEMLSDEPEDPLSITTAHEIKRFDKTPNLKATETLLTAYI